MDKMPSYKNDGLTAGDYSEGNCGPTCLTNLAKFFYDERGKSKLEDTSWSNTYKKLRTGCGYVATGLNAGTAMQNMGPALTNYAKGRGYSCTVGSTNLGCNWTNFTQVLATNIPVLVGVNGWENSTKYVGHDIIAVGYLRLSDGQKFLRIVDEWHSDDDRYCVLNTGTGFTSIEGYTVQIS